MLFSLSAPEPKNRVRPPRVELTYEVMVEGTLVKQQLPFVVGVIADLSGMSEEPLPPLADRKFVAIDFDNFDAVMYAVSPALKFTVENKLEGDGPPLHVDLHFGNIDDFQPEAMARQVPALKQLLDVRSAFADMTEWLTGSDRLQEAVQQLCADPARMDRLATSANLTGAKLQDAVTAGSDLSRAIGVQR